MLNIAVISNLYPPIQTGSSHWASELAHGLASKGHRVIVITAALDGVEKEENLNGIRVYRLRPLFRLPKSPFFLKFDQFYLLFRPTNFFKMVRILRENKIDVLHQVGQLLDTVLMTPLLSWITKIPAICSIHTVIKHPGNTFINFLLQLIDKFFLGKCILGHFKGYLTLDREIENYIARTYPNRPSVLVPVCLADEILQEAPADLENRRGTGPLRIISVGHITEHRDRSELLHAVAQLKKKGIEIELTLVGKILTPTPVNLTKSLGIESNVHFAGEVPRKNLFDLLRVQDLEAHWIYMPGLGTAALEAMAIGLPVVVFAYPGIYGHVPLIDSKNLFFVEPSKLEGIVKTFETLALNPELRIEVGREARRTVANYLTWTKCIPLVEECYRNALETKDLETSRPLTIRTPSLTN